MTGIGIAHPGGGGAELTAGSAGRPLRVLVVYEAGTSGAAALREASELASAGAQLAVITLAPQARTLRCCGGGGAGPYNCAMRDVAAEELLEARTLLGSLAERTTFDTLAGMPRPPLAQWIRRESIDVVFVPRRRFGRRGGALARELSAEAVADVRVIS